jgi:hypothetical protein
MMHLPNRNAQWRMACYPAKLWSVVRLNMLGEPDEYVGGTPVERGGILTQVRQVPRSLPVILYKGKLIWTIVRVNADERLVLARQL